MLTIFNNYYENSPKLFTKIIIQLLLLLCIADIIWFSVMSSVWSKNSTNEYFLAQNSLRIMAQIICWIQIIVKLGLGYYLFLSFKSRYPHELAYLTNLNYKQTNAVTLGHNSENVDNEDLNNPYK